VNITDAPIPEARWAGPSDSMHDLHYNRFELWVNDLYERQEQYDLGFYGDFDEALQSDLLFDVYLDDYRRSQEP